MCKYQYCTLGKYNNCVGLHYRSILAVNSKIDTHFDGNNILHNSMFLLINNNSMFLAINHYHIVL